MSRGTAQEYLREYLNIINGGDVMRYAKALDLGPLVMLSYRPQQTGRASQNAAWQVLQHEGQSDPKAFWRDYGNKTFDVFDPRRQRDEQQAAAEQWASKRYGVEGWAKITGLSGYLFPKVIADRVNADLRAARKAYGSDLGPRVYSLFRTILPGEWRKALGGGMQGSVYLAVDTRAEAAEMLGRLGMRDWEVRQVSRHMGADIGKHLSGSAAALVEAGLLPTGAGVAYIESGHGDAIIDITDPALPIIARFNRRDYKALTVERVQP